MLREYEGHVSQVDAAPKLLRRATSIIGSTAKFLGNLNSGGSGLVGEGSASIMCFMCLSVKPFSSSQSRPPATAFPIKFVALSKYRRCAKGDSID